MCTVIGSFQPHCCSGFACPRTTEIESFHFLNYIEELRWNYFPTAITEPNKNNFFELFSITVHQQWSNSSTSWRSRELKNCLVTGMISCLQQSRISMFKVRCLFEVNSWITSSDSLQWDLRTESNSQIGSAIARANAEVHQANTIALDAKVSFDKNGTICMTNFYKPISDSDKMHFQNKTLKKWNCQSGMENPSGSHVQHNEPR